MEREITKLFSLLNEHENKYPNIVSVNRKILEFHLKKLNVKNLKQMYLLILMYIILVLKI